jgi:hypothetical protein
LEHWFLFTRLALFLVVYSHTHLGKM